MEDLSIIYKSKSIKSVLCKEIYIEETRCLVFKSGIPKVWSVFARLAIFVTLFVPSDFGRGSGTSSGVEVTVILAILACECNKLLLDSRLFFDISSC